MYILTLTPNLGKIILEKMKMSGNRNNNNKSSAGGKKSAKEEKKVATETKEPGTSTDSLLSFLSSASSVMRKAMDVTKQGSAANSRKRDPNHRRHLINNMKESSLEYSAYNKRRWALHYCVEL